MDVLYGLLPWTVQSMSEIYIILRISLMDNTSGGYSLNKIHWSYHIHDYCHEADEPQINPLNHARLYEKLHYLQGGGWRGCHSRRTM